MLIAMIQYVFASVLYDITYATNTVRYQSQRIFKYLT